jgi:hypothetical protein
VGGEAWDLLRVVEIRGCVDPEYGEEDVDEIEG